MKGSFRALVVLVLLVGAAACDGEPRRSTTDAGVDGGALELGALGDGGPADGVARDSSGPDQAGVDGAGADMGSQDLALHPARYPTGRRHSPLTPAVASALRAIAAVAPRRAERFSKIGNSITVSSSFMRCFDGGTVDLDGRTSLAPTVSHFAAAIAGGPSSYRRTSLCATVGWAAHQALAGSPSPLQQEVAAISPRFALVMYGTNDIGWGNIFAYANNMLDIADELVGAGVIPILSSIPPRDDSVSADAQVPRYNAVVRGIAQGLQIPFVDYHAELLPLPDHGLGADKLHPSSYVSSGVKPCVFTAAGLRHGYNVRNLLAMEALHRAKSVVVDGAAAPDGPGPALVGDGSPTSPFVIDADSFPFTHLATTAGSPHSVIHRYTGCAATQDESGPERYYRLELRRTTKLRFMVFDRGAVDIDLHLLDQSGSAAGCLERDDKEIVRTLAAGSYVLTLDTFVTSTGAKAGEYLLVIVEE